MMLKQKCDTNTSFNNRYFKLRLYKQKKGKPILLLDRKQNKSWHYVKLSVAVVLIN